LLQGDRLVTVVNVAVAQLLKKNNRNSKINKTKIKVLDVCITHNELDMNRLNENKLCANYPST